MLTYLLRRLTLAVPVLVLVSLLAFLLLRSMPGDPVDRWLSGGGAAMKGQPALLKAEKAKIRKQLGLDLPVFYCSVATLAHPDTLHRIVNPEYRIWLGRLVENSGNWEAVEAFGGAVLDYQNKIAADVPYHVSSRVSRWSTVSDLEELRMAIDSLISEDIDPELSFAKEEMAIRKNLEEMTEHAAVWKTWIPAVHFHGENQYHRWLFGDGNWLTGAGAVHSKGILRGDFGWSLRTRQPISERLGSRIGWSLLFSLLAIFIALGISLPLGTWMAARANRGFDRLTGLVVFALFSMPVFVAGVLLLMLFANPDVLNWFPVSFYDSSQLQNDASSLEHWSRLWPHLVLPLITYSYGAFAFLSRTVRASVMEVLPADFMRTARAKGLSESQVLFRHGLRNALLPVITILANVLPSALGGSVLIESIFSIPGMGLEVFQAVGFRDYPVVIAIVTLAGLFTIVGYLLSDLAYAWADPRIRINRSLA